jgi:hypothetical protein
MKPSCPDGRWQPSTSGASFGQRACHAEECIALDGPAIAERQSTERLHVDLAAPGDERHRAGHLAALDITGHDGMQPPEACCRQTGCAHSFRCCHWRR